MLHQITFFVDFNLTLFGSMEKLPGKIRQTPEINTHLVSWATPPGYNWKGETNWSIDVALNNNNVCEGPGHFKIDQEETRVAQ